MEERRGGGEREIRFVLLNGEEREGERESEDIA